MKDVLVVVVVVVVEEASIVDHGGEASGLVFFGGEAPVLIRSDLNDEPTLLDDDFCGDGDARMR